MTDKRNVHWSDEEKDQLQALWLSGYSDEHIAKVMGRSQRSVATKRNKMGFCMSRPTQRPKKRLSDYTTSSLMRELNKRGYSIHMAKRER